MGYAGSQLPEGDKPGRFLEAFLFQLVFGDVVGNADDSGNLPAVVAYRLVPGVERLPPHLHPQGVGLAGECTANALQNRWHVLVNVEDRLSHHLTGFAVQNLQTLPLGEGEDPLAVQGEQDHGRAVDDHAKTLLRLPQGPFGALALGDISADALGYPLSFGISHYGSAHLYLTYLPAFAIVFGLEPRRSAYAHDCIFEEPEG